MRKQSAAHVWTCVLLTCVLQKTTAKTEDVTCVFSEDCVLPCRFTPSGGDEVRWFRQDVLIYPPGAEWNGRTSVWVRELSLGNASLLLQRCVVNDRGRYRCQVTKRERTDDFFVALKVEAPIRSVDLQTTRLSGYEEVKCSTSDVYPAPHVSWSVRSATPGEKLEYTTRKMADEKGLYTVESKLKRLESPPGLTYTCIINSSSAAETWTASLSETVHNNVTSSSELYTSSKWSTIHSAEGQDLAIPCRSPWKLKNFTLTWSFSRADASSIICTYDSGTRHIWNRWNGTARLALQRLQEGDATLSLLGVRSLEHTGEFMCNISELQRNHVGHARVNVTALHPENKELEVKHATPWWIPVIVVLAVVLVATAVIVTIVKLQNKSGQSAGKVRYSREVKVSINKSEEITEGSRLNSDPNNPERM